MLLIDDDVDDVDNIDNINDADDAKANNYRSRKKKDHVSTLVSIESNDS
jgi:hypothetical protein